MRTPDKKNKMQLAKRLLGTRVGVFVLACLASVPAFALQALDNAQMAAVNGQDGVDLTLNTSNLSAQALGLRLNASDTTGNTRGGLEIQNISYTPVNDYGADMTGSQIGQLVVGLDMGQSTTGVPGGAISLNLPNRERFYTSNVKLFGSGGTGADTGNTTADAVGSLGELAYDASGKLVFSNVGGLFNADDSTNSFMLYGKLTNATMFWRLDSGNPIAPYLVMTQGQTFWHAYNARIGVQFAGLTQDADLIDLGLQYTTRFKQPLPSNTDTRMTLCTAGSSSAALCTPNYNVSGLAQNAPTDPGIGMYRFGWGGTISQPHLVFSGGGVQQAAATAGQDPTDTNPNSEGVRIIAQWNYLSNDGSDSGHFGQYWNGSAYVSAGCTGSPTTCTTPPYAKGVTASNFSNNNANPDTTHGGFYWFLGNESELPTVSNPTPTPVSIQLANWRNLPGAAYGNNFDIRTGVVNAGQGASSLCFGYKGSSACGTGNIGQTVNISPSGPGLGVAVRNSSILAYSERIVATDPVFAGYLGTTQADAQKTFAWGLINSFSHLDANIYIYPFKDTSGTAAYTGNQVIADLLLMGQTLDDANGTLRRSTGLTGARVDGNGYRATNFGDGSHMLIADTGDGNGIGMLDMSFLLMARQTHILMKPMANVQSTACGVGAASGCVAYTPTTTANDPYGLYNPANYVASNQATPATSQATAAAAAEAYQGGLDFTSGEVRYNLYATFGGIDLPSVGQTSPYTYYPSYGEACPGTWGTTCPYELVGGINSWNYEGFFNFHLSPHPAYLSGQPNSQYLGYALTYRATSYNVADTINGASVAADLLNSPAYSSTNLGTAGPSGGAANPLIGTAPSGRCVATGSCSGQGTMFGTAEPSQQNALVTTGAITGDMAFVNGQLMITAGSCVTVGGGCALGANYGGSAQIDYSPTGSVMPGLTFSHNILIGMSAYDAVAQSAEVLGGIATIPGGASKQPFLINRMEFNGQNLGSIAVPKGNYFGTATLMPQRL